MKKHTHIGIGIGIGLGSVLITSILWQPKPLITWLFTRIPPETPHGWKPKIWGNWEEELLINLGLSRDER